VDSEIMSRDKFWHFGRAWFHDGRHDFHLLKTKIYLILTPGIQAEKARKCSD